MHRTPSEVVQDILQYVNPHRLHKISGYSRRCRIIVNGMCRARYIEKWLDTCVGEYRYIYYPCQMTENDIKDVLENNWYFTIVLTDDTYEVSMECLANIRNRILFLAFDLHYIRLKVREEIELLGSVHSLDLDSVYIKDKYVGMLSNVRYLNISNTEIKDVSMLCNVHTLIIYRCLNIVDISMLDSVYKLYINKSSGKVCVNNNNLYNLYNICDNSLGKLGNIHTLQLQLYKNISVNTMRAIGNVHTLDLSHCTNINEANMGIGICELAHVHTLYLSYSNMIDISALGSVCNLQLQKCKYIRDVGWLGSVNTLNIMGCDVEDITMVANVNNLKYARVVAQRRIRRNSGDKASRDAIKKIKKKRKKSG